MYNKGCIINSTANLYLHVNLYLESPAQHFSPL